VQNAFEGIKVVRHTNHHLIRDLANDFTCVCVFDLHDQAPELLIHMKAQITTTITHGFVELLQRLLQTRFEFFKINFDLHGFGRLYFGCGCLRSIRQSSRHIFSRRDIWRRRSYARLWCGIDRDGA